MFDGIGMGLGFTIALTLLGAVREFLGTGKIFDLTIMPEEYGMLVFVLAPGAFIALGYLIALIPIAVSTFLDTPKNGQIPRNCDNTMLFTKIAEININIYSIFFSYLIELGFLETVNQRNEVSQSDESARSQYKHQHSIFFRPCIRRWVCSCR